MTDVVAALIWDGPRFMICQRPAHKARGLLWEFVGGKVEPGESFVASAIREIYEETGLEIANPVPCGVVHWAHKESGNRYIEYLYRADSFHGTLKEGTDEGRVFWMDKEDLRASDRLSPNFDLYLPLFLDGGYSELFFDWDGKSWNAVPLVRIWYF